MLESSSMYFNVRHALILLARLCVCAGLCGQLLLCFALMGKRDLVALL